jgi:hypothetical protein
MNRSLAFTLVAAIFSIAFGPVAGADAPPGRYTLASRTVKDRETGLAWSETEQPGGPFTWAEAKSQCPAPWRLPTVQELRTLVDLTQAAGPTIDTSVFHGQTSGSAPSAEGFWSSTPYLLGASDYVFYVAFQDGAVDAKVGTVAMGVRCVE